MVSTVLKVEEVDMVDKEELILEEMAELEGPVLMVAPVVLVEMFMPVD